MGLKKGQCNNVSGRPVGAVGKANQDIKQWVKQLLQSNQAQFNADLMEVKAIERLQVITSLLKFAIPTLASTTIEASIAAEYNELKILLDSASPEAIEQISNKIIQLNSQTKN